MANALDILPVDQAVVARSPKDDTAMSAIVTADGTLLAANGNRKGYFIQNLAAATVYVKEGAGALSTDFSYVLKAGTGANDGLGGTFYGVIYTGIITIKASGGAPRVVVTEW